ncbi:hypothetical protein Tco_0779707 [Tanacetum coccineum]
MNDEQRASDCKSRRVWQDNGKDEKQELCAKANPTKQIDGNDLSVHKISILKRNEIKDSCPAREYYDKYLKESGNYKIRAFKGMSYDR